MIREIVKDDLDGLLQLYTHLHHNPLPAPSPDLSALWHEILEDENHHIIVATVDEKIVSSCVCVIIPNLTNGQRPYALIENVVTNPCYRKRGFAGLCLNYARDIALRKNCYKIMLLTGSKLESTLQFYEQAGYDRNEKTAFIQRL